MFATSLVSQIPGAQKVSPALLQVKAEGHSQTLFLYQESALCQSFLAERHNHNKGI